MSKPRPSPGSSALACDLGALSAMEQEERAALSTRFLEAVRQVGEIANGFEFELDRKSVSIRELAAWVELEQKCCPFLDFVLKDFRDPNSLTLVLLGRRGVKVFIRAEFSPAFP